MKTRIVHIKKNVPILAAKNIIHGPVGEGCSTARRYWERDYWGENTSHVLDDPASMCVTTACRQYWKDSGALELAVDAVRGVAARVVNDRESSLFKVLVDDGLMRESARRLARMGEVVSIPFVDHQQRVFQAVSRDSLPSPAGEESALAWEWGSIVDHGLVIRTARRCPSPMDEAPEGLFELQSVGFKTEALQELALVPETALVTFDISRDWVHSDETTVFPPSTFQDDVPRLRRMATFLALGFTPWHPTVVLPLAMAMWSLRLTEYGAPFTRATVSPLGPVGKAASALGVPMSATHKTRVTNRMDKYCQEWRAAAAIAGGSPS